MSSKKRNRARQRQRQRARQQQQLKSRTGGDGRPQSKESPGGRPPGGRPLEADVRQKDPAKPSDAQKRAGAASTNGGTGVATPTRRSERLEKREQARQAKIRAARKRAAQRRRKRLMVGALALTIVAALVVFGVLRWQRGRAVVAEEAKRASCGDIETFEPVGRQHVDAQDPPPRVPYNSDPPTSGDHFGARVPDWGAYDETLQPELYVHNLEHGGTVVHYRDKDLSDEEKDQLDQLADKYPVAVITMPSPDIDAPVIATAWGAMRKCQKVSVEVLEHFVRERCNKSPEPGAQCGRPAPGQQQPTAPG